MTIHFTEERFPIDISYGSSGGPEYYTDVITTASGHEQRNINWTEGRARYNVSHGVKTEQQMQELLSFFRAHKGKGIGFRFKDWLDYSAQNQFIAMGNDKTHVFQLQKQYLSGHSCEIRVIKKPVPGTVIIYLNNVLQETGVNVDHSTGIISFIKPPGIGTIINASFEFDVPARFDTDYFIGSIDDFKAYSWQEIAIVEVKV